MTATQAEVKVAYKKMAAVVHPDKGGSAMLFRLVQEAYEVLSDPAKRKQHDSDLIGPSGGNRQAGTQQQQSQTSSSEANYVRVEDLYKRWKEDRNRVAMPRAESYAAGGVRKFVRESVFVIVTPDLRPNDIEFAGCGNCGFQMTVSLRSKNPAKIEILGENHGVFLEGQNLRACQKCGQPPGKLRVLRWQEDSHRAEAISIDTGDLLFFNNGKIFGTRNSFGFVVDGSARNEFGLKSLKVLDEFSGQAVCPKGWWDVWGHWKSNDLSVGRFGSMRNWGS